MDRCSHHGADFSVLAPPLVIVREAVQASDLQIQFREGDQDTEISVACFHPSHSSGAPPDAFDHTGQNLMASKLTRNFRIVLIEDGGEGIAGIDWLTTFIQRGFRQKAAHTLPAPSGVGTTPFGFAHHRPLLRYRCGISIFFCLLLRFSLLFSSCSCLSCRLCLRLLFRLLLRIIFRLLFLGSFFRLTYLCFRYGFFPVIFHRTCCFQFLVKNSLGFREKI